MSAVPERKTIVGIELLPDVVKPDAALADDSSDSERQDIWAELKGRRFDLGNKPPIDRAIYILANSVISTPGNLCAITAAVKSGKSALMGAMMASTMTTGEDADCLGFTSTNPDGHAVIHFDTEQSRYDHWQGIKRMLERAGLENPPDWFYSYSFAGLDAKSLGLYTWFVIDQIVSQKHSRIHSIFLDGVADYVNDVNDPKECNPFVSELHGIAIARDCSIICAIHLNPGSTKTRGHLGSQIERKAETNLLLEKDTDDITTVWSNKQRRAPIPRETGPCFQWSETYHRHVSVENPKVKERADKEESNTAALSRLAKDMFRAGEKLLYGDMVAYILKNGANGKSVKERTAKSRIDDMCELGLIQKGNGKLYELCS